MRFEIKVNPIPHGCTGTVNPNTQGDSGRNLPPYQENVCLYFCQAQPQLQLQLSWAGLVLLSAFTPHSLCNMPT